MEQNKISRRNFLRVAGASATAAAMGGLAPAASAAGIKDLWSMDLQILATELNVTIKRRSDQSPVWEGHARTFANRPDADAAVADKLTRALFAGFPGESGRTVTVK